MTEEKNTEQRKKHAPLRRSERQKEMLQYEWMHHWQRISSRMISLALGFFFGGTQLAPGVAPLGCALVSALPSHGILAMIGIWMRYLYEELLGEGVLLHALCATICLAARIALCLAVYGRELLLRANRQTQYFQRHREEQGVSSDNDLDMRDTDNFYLSWGKRASNGAIIRK